MAPPPLERFERITVKHNINKKATLTKTLCGYSKRKMTCSE